MAFDPEELVTLTNHGTFDPAIWAIAAALSGALVYLVLYG